MNESLDGSTIAGSRSVSSSMCRSLTSSSKNPFTRANSLGAWFLSSGMMNFARFVDSIFDSSK